MLFGKFLLKSQIPHDDAFVSTEAKAQLLLAPILTVQLAIADSLRDVGAPDVGGVVQVSHGACHFEDSSQNDAFVRFFINKSRSQCFSFMECNPFAVR